MLEFNDEGYETLSFKRPNGTDFTMEVDVFRLHDDLIALAASEGSDLTVSARIAAKLEGMAAATAQPPDPPLQVSHRLAWQFFNAIVAKVEELKKNDPYYRSAGKAEPTASPSGPTPGEG